MKGATGKNRNGMEDCRARRIGSCRITDSRYREVEMVTGKLHKWTSLPGMGLSWRGHGFLKNTREGSDLEPGRWDGLDTGTGCRGVGVGASLIL